MAKEFRRKAPRRDYSGNLGLLHLGKMIPTQCIQIGEGGALVGGNSLTEKVEVHDKFIFTVFFPNIGGVTTSAQCLYKTDNGSFGVAFQDLSMTFKKRIREYVSRRKV